MYDYDVFVDDDELMMFLLMTVFLLMIIKTTYKTGDSVVDLEESLNNRAQTYWFWMLDTDKHHDDDAVADIEKCDKT